MTLFTVLLFCACCFICLLYLHMDFFSFYARPYVFTFYVTVCECHIVLKATWLDLTWSCGSWRLKKASYLFWYDQQWTVAMFPLIKYYNFAKFQLIFKTPSPTLGMIGVNVWVMSPTCRSRGCIIERGYRSGLNPACEILTISNIGNL